MVIALISGSSNPGSCPSWGHCIVFLGKTLNSHSASLHPVVLMGTGELNAGACMQTVIFLYTSCEKATTMTVLTSAYMHIK